ncbi:DUF421 domain-containing protein [Mycoplasmatota bacterium]|nr:DUF421 domain-containing protein [Mycoplasmatota bacterium]
MLNSIYTQITIELIGGFIALLISVKIIGKRQISQITPFDFISAIVLGEILGNAVYDKDTNILHIFYSLFLWTILLYIIEKISQKSIKSRDIIQGTPTFIVKKGKFDFNKIKKEGLDFAEVLSLFREKGVFSIQDVDYVILESSGKISIIQNTDDLAKLTLPVVLDGKIVKENLNYTNHDENWLLEKLEKFQISNLKQVLYAEWNVDDDIYIQKKSDE